MTRTERSTREPGSNRPTSNSNVFATPSPQCGTIDAGTRVTRKMTQMKEIGIALVIALLVYFITESVARIAVK